MRTCLFFVCVSHSEPPPLPRDESVVRLRGSTHLSHVHALHFGLGDWIMTKNFRTASTLVTHTVSELLPVYSRPHAFDCGNQVLCLKKTKKMNLLGIEPTLYPTKCGQSNHSTTGERQQWTHVHVRNSCATSYCDVGCIRSEPVYICDSHNPEID